MIKTLVRLIVAAMLLLATLAPLPAQQDRSAPPAKPAGPTALDHLRAVRTTIGEVRTEMLTADASAKIKDIRQRLATLEQSYVSHGKKSTSKQETPSGSTRVRIAHEGTWSAQVPEIDKLLGDLIDSKTSITQQADASDGVKRKLSAARADLTAFAKGASGTGGPGR